jgi:Glycosyltransferase (GlcNAc)
VILLAARKFAVTTPKTIYVSIASYRDSELKNTVLSLFSSWSGITSLKVVVVIQGDHKEQQVLDDQHFPELRVLKYHYLDAMGVCWARKQSYSLYDREPYVLQIDSHSIFVSDWDLILLDQYGKALELTPKPILTGYPPGYQLVGSQRVTDPAQLSNRDIVVTWASGLPMGHPIDRCAPYPLKHLHICGCFIFTDGKFVEDIPYDEQIVFWGEEPSLALRAYCRDWRMMTIGDHVLWHYWQGDGMPRLRKVLWEDDIERGWRVSEIHHQQAMPRLQSILRGTLRGVYGVDNLDKFDEYSRLSFERYGVSLFQE